MKTIHKTLIAIFAVIIIIILVFILGRQVGLKIADNTKTEKEVDKIEVKVGLTTKQIDSIYKELSKNQEMKVKYIEKELGVIKQIEKVVIEKPKDSVCNDLYDKATLKINLLNKRIAVKDTIEKESNNIIKNQYSIIDKKDSIIYYKNTQLELYKNRKPNPKRIGLGIQVGYGLSLLNSKVETRPYVGVGVSYNVFNF